jgi:hypothetical protein
MYHLYLVQVMNMPTEHTHKILRIQDIGIRWPEHFHVPVILNLGEIDSKYPFYSV